MPLPAAPFLKLGIAVHFAVRQFYRKDKEITPLPVCDPVTEWFNVNTAVYIIIVVRVFNPS